MINCLVRWWLHDLARHSDMFNLISCVDISASVEVASIPSAWHYEPMPLLQTVVILFIDEGEHPLIKRQEDRHHAAAFSAAILALAASISSAVIGGSIRGFCFAAKRSNASHRPGGTPRLFQLEMAGWVQPISSATACQPPSKSIIWFRDRVMPHRFHHA